VRCSSALTSLAALVPKSESVPSCDLLEITLPVLQSAQLDDCAQDEFDSARVDANRCLATEGDDSIVCLAAQSGKLLLNPYDPLEVLYMSSPCCTVPPATYHPQAVETGAGT
jgi:hypothetical protein